MTTEQAIQQVRDILLARYPGYANESVGVRVLLAASVLVGDFEVKEEGGSNRGDWVEAIQRSGGGKAGDPWCAFAIEFCMDVANVPEADRPRSQRGAVRNWVEWARRSGRIRTTPERGRLCFWQNRNGTGHIGIVASVAGVCTTSLEGNTTPSEGGNQREGDGYYRRIRPTFKWGGFIELDGSR